MKDNKIIEKCLIVITICMVIDLGNTLYIQKKAKALMNEMLEGNFGPGQDE